MVMSKYCDVCRKSFGSAASCAITSFDTDRIFCVTIDRYLTLKFFNVITKYKALGIYDILKRQVNVLLNSLVLRLKI